MSNAFRSLAFGAVATFGWLVLPHSLAAQSIPTRMHILTEEDKDFASCGLSKAGIEGAGKAALRYNRVELVVSEDGIMALPTLYLQITPIEVSQEVCVSLVRVSIIQYDTMPRMNGNYYSGLFQLCSSGALLSGPNQANRVYDEIRNQTEQCLGSIQTTEDPSFVRLILEAAGKQARKEKE